MRLGETIAASLRGKLPKGWALRRTPVLDTLLSVIAGPLAAAEADAAALMDEVDPRQAVCLLPDFERVLGPDPCGRDLSGLTLDQRQQLAHQRWTGRGGQSIPYFVSLAAKRGVAIEIEEFWPTTAGVDEAGEELIGEGEQFTFVAHVPLIDEWDFHAGGNTAGETLGGLTLSDIECDLRRVKPAHAQIVFSYED